MWLNQKMRTIETMGLIPLKLITISTIITFLWSGLTINILQLVNYLLIRPINFRLFTKINYYLMYSAWSQIVALFDWFCGAQFKVYHGRKDQEDDIFSHNNIFLANHSYDLDWVGAWLVTDKFGQLASCKAMLKSDLKYLPVVGWSWALSDQLFLDRNWERDKHKLAKGVDVLLEYKPLVATFFCEGARFTSDKVAECQKFAQERGLKAPKYHLIPRTKGFVAVIKHLKQRQRDDPTIRVSVYNAQVAYDQTGAMNIADIVNKSLTPKGALYFERFNIDEIPGDDEGCAQWLHDLFLKKDTLHEYFLKHGKFPGHLDKRFVQYTPRLTSLANWIFWTLYTILPSIYMVSVLYASYGAVWASSLLAGCIGVAYIYLNYVIYQADVEENKKTQ